MTSPPIRACRIHRRAVPAAAFVVVAACVYTGWDRIVAHYHRFQVRHGSEANAFRAAAALSGGNRRSLDMVQAWALEKASEAARAPASPGHPGHAVMRDETLGKIARAIAETGDIGAARKTADAIGMDGWRKATLAAIDAGERPYPRTVTPLNVLPYLAAAAFAEGSERARGVGRIARMLAEGGQEEPSRRAVDFALRVLRAIPDPEDPSYEDDYKSSALRDVAVAQWKLGDTADSRRNFLRAACLRSRKNEHLIVQAQAEAGDTEGALETAASIKGGFEHVAVVQARNGEFEKALAIAETWRSTGLMALVGAEQRGRGDEESARSSFQRALAVAGEIPAHVMMSHSRAYAYLNIAWKEGASGDARETIDAARREEIPLLRAHLLLGVALGLRDRIATRPGGRPWRS